MKKLTCLLLLTLPAPAVAEVSDKMATQPGLWFSGLLVGVALAIGIRWSRRMNVIGIPLVALFFYSAYDTLAQPDIGPAIMQEQGWPYALALYGSAVLVLIGVLMGNYSNRIRLCHILFKHESPVKKRRAP